MSAPESMPRCPGLRPNLRFESNGSHALAVIGASPVGCELCLGSGRRPYERDGYRFVEPCELEQQRRMAARYSAARLPALYAGKDFDSLVPEFPQMATAIEATRRFCMGFEPGKTTRGLLLTGPVGTGKTHLLCAALGWLTLEMGVSCRYVENSFLFSEIRQGFSKGMSSLDIVEPLAAVAVLAIDELGKGKASPFELETIDELISRRYNAGRPTLLASNHPFGERSGAPGSPNTPNSPNALYPDRSRVAPPPALGEVPLLERVGVRVHSRLSEMCEVIELPQSAPDHRRRIR